MIRFSQPDRLAEDIRAALVSETPYVLTLRLSVVLLLLHGSSAPTMNISINVVCGVLLLFPLLVRQAFLWWTLVIALVIGNGTNWSYVDNHKYLITYWTAACALSLHSPTPDIYLRNTGRILVALVFGFAVFWKLVGGEYLNGSFLYWTFLMDPRVQGVGAWIAGRTFDDVVLASQAIRLMGSLGAEGISIPVHNSASLAAFTFVMSWLVLIGEGAVSVTHFCRTELAYALGHTLLIGFIISTYFLLPVYAFAFVLTVLGFAQCKPEGDRLRRLYLTLFVLIQFTAIPWQTLFRS